MSTEGEGQQMRELRRALRRLVRVENAVARIRQPMDEQTTVRAGRLVRDARARARLARERANGRR